MTSSLGPFAALALAATLAGQTAVSEQKGRGKGTQVAQDSFALPFNLTQADLPRVEVFYAFYSGKTGAGKQELKVKAAGVTLLRTRSMDAAPEIREAPLPPQAIWRLLDVLAEENVFGLEEEYPAPADPYYRRLLRVTIPGRTKSVIVEGPAPAEFERITGALRFAASMALPETLLRRFFPNL